MKVLHNKLKELRLKQNYSQEELADNIGVSRQTIISIEKSVYKPSVELALKLSNKLKLKVEDIFFLK